MYLLVFRGIQGPSKKIQGQSGIYAMHILLTKLSKARSYRHLCLFGRTKIYWRVTKPGRADAQKKSVEGRFHNGNVFYTLQLKSDNRMTAPGDDETESPSASSLKLA